MRNFDNTITYKRLRKIAETTDHKKVHDLRVGMIVPPSPFVVPCGWEFVHSAPFEGPSVIAAVLKGLGVEVVLLDRREDIDPEKLKGGPLKKLDIVCCVSYEDSFPYQKRVIEIAKAEEKDRPVIIGGPLVSSVPELIMNNTMADYAVIGEGELTTIELMDRLMGVKGAPELSDIDGLAYRSENGKVVQNKRREQMTDIDAVPLQDISVWPSVMKTGSAAEIYMTSSRGCPGNCSFCYRAMPLLRHKSPERVRRELEYLKRYGYKFVWWSDLTFIDDKKRVHELMDGAFSGIDFRWCCFTRVDGLSREVLKHMKENGCDIVMFGFESITSEILKYFRKKISQNQMVKAIELTREAGLKVGGLFILGAPGETRESLERVVEFSREFREVTRVKYMSALPGTTLYYDALKNGIIKDELEHLYFLSRERSVEDDEILSFSGVPEHELRSAYRAINGQIEVRPYEYWNECNRFLDAPKKFKDRLV
ncbi:MAG: radical SAM protein [Candidatus Omnitrophica bacterium]|nr:radical SAM protein [Candidatus Omnitrophota bacterium]